MSFQGNCTMNLIGRDGETLLMKRIRPSLMLDRLLQTQLNTSRPRHGDPAKGRSSVRPDPVVVLIGETKGFFCKALHPGKG